MPPEHHQVASTEIQDSCDDQPATAGAKRQTQPAKPAMPYYQLGN
jgi:hypothetical protein